MDTGGGDFTRKDQEEDWASAGALRISPKNGMGGAKASGSGVVCMTNGSGTQPSKKKPVEDWNAINR